MMTRISHKNSKARLDLAQYHGSNTRKDKDLGGFAKERPQTYQHQLELEQYPLQSLLHCLR